MNSPVAGVAISTTGDPHRLNLLAHAVAWWRTALSINGSSEGVPIFVTVDGGAEAFDRVVKEVGYEPVTFVWVGQGRHARDGHQGVAVNKNTGLELLMDAGVDRLFLSDDDCWPRKAESLALHTGLGDLGIPHSMVCWGRHRLPVLADGVGTWSWPRGVVLYVERPVVEALGGMDERFGPGGHEHVEYSRRIYQAGFTPHEYPTPPEYVSHGGMGAAMYWHAEDMAQRGEAAGVLRARKKRLTSVRRVESDWPVIEAVMAEHDGKPGFVPYRAAENGRASATMSSHTGA